MFDKMVEVIGSTRYSSDDLKVAAYHLYKKLAAAAFYNPNKKFSGPSMLIKATENFIPLEKDYGLSQVRFLSLIFSEILRSIFTIFLSYRTNF